jgi:hypothetical protein
VALERAIEVYDALAAHADSAGDAAALTDRVHLSHVPFTLLAPRTGNRPGQGMAMSSGYSLAPRDLP